jgi:hypothetical protein
MQSENKTCQNCKKDFTIEPDDFSFYEKIQVPPPTFCPECRMQRRMAFMNIYSVYKRPCDKCGEQTISMFHKAKEYTVYCSKCWWADDWDGSEYAMEYDPQKSIFEQIDELHKRTPHMSLDTLHSSLVDTHYTNYSSHLKRCYGLFFADYAENCMYAEFVNGMTDTMDCLRVKDCELCYGSVGIHKCSRVFYSEECDSCVEVYFSKNCSGCTNCFGCMNLRNKSYCVYNQQYTKEQYEQFMLEANIHSGDSLDVHSMQAREFWLTLPVRAYHGNSLNVSVSGDYVYESKNTHDAYLVSGAEDSKYVQLLSVPFTRDAYDYTCWGGNSEKIYETLVAGHGANTILFSIGAYPDAMNQEYCFYASACKNSFGCVNLKRKKYSILNKEYSKEAYERLRETIIADMKQYPYIDPRGNTYTYGEFFPPNLSPFGYNETAAYEYFPLSESEAKQSWLFIV